MSKSISGFILAGGKSSRIGKDKALLAIQDETFLERSARKLRAFCDELYVVLNSTQLELLKMLPSDVRPIFDLFEGRGAMGGIHAALMHCKDEIAFILAVDLPLVEPWVIESIIKNSFSSGMDVFIARGNDGIIQPLCGAYRVDSCKSISEKLLSEQNSVSVQQFLERVKVGYLKVEESMLFNVNTIEDYHRALEICKNQRQ